MRLSAGENSDIASSPGKGSEPLYRRLGLERIDLFGTPVDRIDLDGACRAFIAAAKGPLPITAITSNVDIVMRARAEEGFREDMWRADLVVPDGVPLLWAGRAQGTPLRGRVNGTDIVERCAALAAADAMRIGLIGGTGDAGVAAADTLRRRNPGLDIVAVTAIEPIPAGPDPENAARVREVGVDLLFVGLGSPKQDRWLDANLAATGALVGIGVGSSVDIIAGVRHRAPRWMQRSGLEWSWRLVQEPRRLARRYLLVNSPFLLLILRAAIRRGLRGLPGPARPRSRS